MNRSWVVIAESELKIIDAVVTVIATVVRIDENFDTIVAPIGGRIIDKVVVRYFNQDIEVCAVPKCSPLTGKIGRVIDRTDHIRNAFSGCF